MYLPYSVSENGKYSGFNRQVLDAFAKTYGYQFEYKAMPVARLNYQFLTVQDLDFRFPENPNWSEDLKQDLQLYYSEPVVSYIDGVMVSKERSKINISQLKKLALIRGFSPIGYQEKISRWEIATVPSNSAIAAVKMVARGRAAGVYINLDVANFLLNRVILGPGSLVFNRHLPFTKDAYHLATIKHPKIIKEFNTFLANNQPMLRLMKKRAGISAAEN